MAGILDQLYAEEQRLREERAAAQKQAAETSPSGGRTAAAWEASERLTKLNDDYRLLLQAITTAESKSASTEGSPISAPSSQKTIMMQYPDGTRSEIPNPNYAEPNSEADIRQIGSSVLRVNPKTGQVDVLYTVPKEPSAPTGQLTEYQKWQMAQYPEETAYARGRDAAADEHTRGRDAVADLKAEQDRFAGNIRQLSGDYSNAWKEALQYQVAPGTQYIPGMETGGLMDQLQKKRGYTYNAEPWRLTEVPFDPWQAAIQMEKKNRK